MSLLHSLGSLVVLDRALASSAAALESDDPVIVRRAGTSTQRDPDALLPDFVKNMIDRIDAVPEQSRLGRDDYIHVSSLVDLCPRQYYLAHEHGTEDYGDHLGRSFTGGLLVTFALGRAIDKFVKERVVEATRRRGMFGMWTCKCGFSARTGLYVAERCERCRGPTDVYNEPVLRNEEWRITGRPDITLMDSNGHMLPIEVKSMARDRWEHLDAPLANDILQTLLYRWMYAQEGRLVHTHVVVLYVSKEFRYGSPYKEFQVDAETAPCRSMLALALGLAAQARDARDSHAPPARELCSGVTCTRARNCPVQALCFGME